MLLWSTYSVWLHLIGIHHISLSLSPLWFGARTCSCSLLHHCYLLQFSTFTFNHILLHLNAHPVKPGVLFLFLPVEMWLTFLLDKLSVQERPIAAGSETSLCEDVSQLLPVRFPVLCSGHYIVLRLKDNGMLSGDHIWFVSAEQLHRCLGMFIALVVRKCFCFPGHIKGTRLPFVEKVPIKYILLF